MLSGIAHKVTASAPGKLVILGEHAVVYGRPCIVTAVGQRLFVTATPIDKPVLELSAPDVGLEAYSKPFAKLGTGEVPKAAAFVEGALKTFLQHHPLRGGVRLETRSEFSSQYGFGSSSASAVCAIRALGGLIGLAMPPREVFDLSFRTVRDIQKTGSGVDVAAAVYGGTLVYEMEGRRLEALPVTPPLVVGYTGIKADTVTLLKEVAARAEREPESVEAIYIGIEALVEQGIAAIKKKDWKALGEVMNHNQALLETLGVSSAVLDALIAAARGAGATGAKLSGAGRGDCMLALAATKKHAVEGAIAKAGGHVIEVALGVDGVRLEA